MHLRLTFLLAAISFGTLSAADHPGKLKAGKAVEFRGKIEGDLDISGGVVVGKFLLIVSNEAHGVQVLKPTGDGDYEIVGDLIELAPKGTALDLEAMTAEGNTIYVTGSHSRLRPPSMKEGDSVPSSRPPAATGSSASNSTRTAKPVKSTASAYAKSSMRMRCSKRSCR